MMMLIDPLSGTSIALTTGAVAVAVFVAVVVLTSYLRFERRADAALARAYGSHSPSRPLIVVSACRVSMEPSFVRLAEVLKGLISSVTDSP